MQTQINTFKKSILTGKAQLGLWLSLADGYAAEISAGAGFDWLLIDGEHAPNDLRSVLAQLQAIAGAGAALPPGRQPPHGVVRVPTGDAVLIKQYLDIGAQTILVPMVNTADEAAHLVQAMRYPPEGIRGMGSALARSSRWQTFENYLHEANAQTCLLVQAESMQAMQNLDAIANTPGVDGVFIGPADLSASMGHVGRPGHPDVQAMIADAIARIRKAGKAAGIFATSKEQGDKWLAAGAQFVAIGADTMLLHAGAKQLLASYRGADNAR